MELPRHIQGRGAFAAFLNQWITLSTLSTTAFATLANRCLGSNRIHASQLSGMRTGLTKQIGVYVFEALASLNAAAVAHHHQGKQPSADMGVAELLPLIPPIEGDDGPLTLGGFAELFLGLREPPALPSVWLGAKAPLPAPAFSFGADIGRIVRQALQADGGDLIDNLQRLIKAYPSGDPARLQRLREVCLGLDHYEDSEAETEAAAICVALSEITGERWSLRRLAEQGQALKPALNH